MVTDIVIPVRDQVHLTKSIVEQLEQMDGWNHCWIYDNGSIDATPEYLRTISRRFTTLPAAGDGIYDMWDRGLHATRFADHVLYLNNDVVLHPTTIECLNIALEASHDNWIAYPDYNFIENNSSLGGYRETKGTYRHGGMSGFCFMLKRKKIDWSPLVDRQFKWWGGDDDIAFTVEKMGGKQVRVVGLPIEHMNEGTARHHDLGAQKGIDLANVIKKWGR